MCLSYISYVYLIYRLTFWVWLTGDLSNPNAKSAIFVRQWNQTESRLTSVDLNLKKACIGVFFRGWNKIHSDAHSCLFRSITSKEEKMIGSRAAWTEAQNCDIMDLFDYCFCKIVL